MANRLRVTPISRPITVNLTANVIPEPSSYALIIRGGLCRWYRGTGGSGFPRQCAFSQSGRVLTI